MTGDTIKEFLVGLGFDVDEAGLAKFQSTIAGATVVATALGAAVLAAGGVVMKFVAGQADAIDRVGDLGDRTNTTTAELLELSHVATLTGSSMDAATSSVEGLAKAQGEAVLGLGRGAMAFKKLGLEPKKANGEMKSTAELLDEIGAKIKDLDRPAQTATLSKLGIDPTLVQALTTDTSALREEFRATYEALGVDLNVAAEEAGLFNDAMDRIRFTADAVMKAVAIRLMPQLRRGIDAMRKSIQANLPLIMAVVTPVANVILRVAEAIVTVGGRILSWLGQLLAVFARLNEATDGWAGYILAAAAAWKYLNLAFLATPLGMILALGAAVLLLVDDFLTWQEGGESLIDWGGTLGQTLQALALVIGGLGAAFAVVKGAMLAATAVTYAMNAAAGIATLAQWAWNAALLANPIGLVTAALFGLIALVPILLANWERVEAFFRPFVDWLLSGFNALADAAGGIAGKVGGFFGFGDDGGAASAPGLTPAPAAAAALGGATQTVDQKTEINVYGATDPAATGRQVAGQQSRVNGDMARNLRSVAK